MIEYLGLKSVRLNADSVSLNHLILHANLKDYFNKLLAVDV